MDVKAQMDYAYYARLQNDVISQKVKPIYHQYVSEGIRLTDAVDDKDSLKKALRCFEMVTSTVTVSISAVWKVRLLR